MTDPSGTPGASAPELGAETGADAAERLGYTLHTILGRPDVARTSPADAAGDPGSDPSAAAEAVRALGVDLRGIYDVSGMRADGEVMLWLTGDRPEALQAALRILRRTPPLAGLPLAWSAMGVHREAEFTRSHSPSFMKGLPPKRWLTVYPFVRSYDWYLLPDAERRQMLADHGRMGSEYPQVQPNTTAAFALGDYEWILALEADELVDLVDLMRHLRKTEARRHIREEIPFYTGRMVEWAELDEILA